MGRWRDSHGRRGLTQRRAVLGHFENGKTLRFSVCRSGTCTASCQDQRACVPDGLARAGAMRQGRSERDGRVRDVMAAVRRDVGAQQQFCMRHKATLEQRTPAAASLSSAAHHLQRPRPMRKLILRNFQSAGDIVMLTAAVRDLHRSYPGEFLTDVRTPFPDLWAHNPHLTPLREDDRGVETIDCHYPLIHEANTTPCHFLHAFPVVSQRSARPADPRHRLQGRHPRFR